MTPVVMFSSDIRPSPFLFAYLPLSRSIPPYHTQIASDCPFPLSLSFITSIVDRPLRYLVADPLSPYPCGCLYLVRYIAPQSSVTVDLDYVPSPW